jgi:hypothetical protein
MNEHHRHWDEMDAIALRTERPWWCARCGNPARSAADREFGVCDPCAVFLRSEREKRAKKNVGGLGK